jgi:hypothetical protein
MSVAALLAAACVLSTATAAGAIPHPVVTYGLPGMYETTGSGCRIGASSTLAAVGVAWGRRVGTSEAYNSFCRGFDLVTLRSGASRAVVRLPGRERNGWAVDQPVLAGRSLAYVEYRTALLGEHWRIHLVNLVTGRSILLDRWHGAGIMDFGPSLTGSGAKLVWIAGRHNAHGQTVDQIHVYDVATRRATVVGTSRPGVRFQNAYMSGPIVCFVARDGSRTDAWVADTRTGRMRQLSHTGNVSIAVITGPWVAWAVQGKNAVGPVRLEDLRTGVTRTIASEPSYLVTAGNGVLGWYVYYASRSSMIDLTNNQVWSPADLSTQQRGQGGADRRQCRGRDGVRARRHSASYSAYRRLSNTITPGCTRVLTPMAQNVVCFWRLLLASGMRISAELDLQCFLVAGTDWPQLSRPRRLTSTCQTC